MYVPITKKMRQRKQQPPPTPSARSAGGGGRGDDQGSSSMSSASSSALQLPSGDASTHSTSNSQASQSLPVVGVFQNPRGDGRRRRAGRRRIAGRGRRGSNSSPLMASVGVVALLLVGGGALLVVMRRGQPSFPSSMYRGTAGADDDMSRPEMGADNNDLNNREKRKLRRRQQRQQEEKNRHAPQTTDKIYGGRTATHQTIGDEIKCPDGSVGYVNDDYCDCSDGSDEPNTSACSHILVQRPMFPCRDGRKTIFASRVRDGIRDCDDGSDELTH